MRHLTALVLSIVARTVVFAALNDVVSRQAAML